MILAGPILRHVDAKSVNIWIAMDENPTIKITLKKGATDLVGESKDATTTYAIGKSLVVKLISFTPNEDLVANEIYSYDLKNGNTSILTPLMDTDDLPLGYEKNKLPSFVLPAKDLKDLVVAHGSCRRMHGEAPEALCLLDDVLKDNTTRNTPNKRIQQVFLTGDQIYADEVPRFGLWSMTQCANKFISDKEDLPSSTVRTPQTPPRFSPADAVPGLRQALLNDDAKMSTGSGGAHLLSFGEFCAGYLHAWSTDVWHQDLINAANLVKTEGISQDTINAQGVVTARGTISRIWDGFDSADTTKKIIGFKKNTGFTVENLRNRPYLLTAKQREDMATYPTFDKFFEVFEKNRKAGVALEVLEVANFMDSVKKVRRVLANTPTYMIFDDHEISDDWNISMKWKNEVYGNTLGKAIVRNGLMAYALFQDLGNTPSEYAKADSKKTALTTEIVNYAKTANFSTFSTVAIDKILGITDGSAKLEINWHYLVNSGPKVKTLFLDTRNRRSFKDLNARPALLSKEAFEEQFKLLPESLSMATVEKVEKLAVFA